MTVFLVVDGIHSTTIVYTKWSLSIQRQVFLVVDGIESTTMCFKIMLVESAGNSTTMVSGKMVVA